ncbi:unnamed protein product [Urochloa humidicola]
MLARLHCQRISSTPPLFVSSMPNCRPLANRCMPTPLPLDDSRTPAGMHQSLLLRIGCWWLRDYHPAAEGHFLVFV